MKITETARGRECQIRIIGHCNYDPNTVVWCHYNGLAGGKGVGKKAADLLGAWGCSSCHDIVDGRMPTKMPSFQIELDFWRGHARTIAKLTEEGFFGK